MRSQLRLIFLAAGMVGMVLALYLGLTVGTAATRLVSQRLQPGLPVAVPVGGEANHPPAGDKTPLGGKHAPPVAKPIEEVGISFASDYPGDMLTERRAKMSVLGSSRGIQRFPHAVTDAVNR
jgi:hypothetical protein